MVLESEMMANLTNCTVGSRVAHTTISLGPSMPLFLRTCMDAAPGRFVFSWVSASAAMMATCLIAYRHNTELSRRPASVLRMYYTRVLWFAPVLAVTAVCALFNPRSFNLMKMLGVQVEAIVLSAFGNIVFLLLANEADSRYAGTSAQDEPLGTKIMSALNAQGRKPHFAVPPFACCFRSCMRAHLLHPKHLLLARFFVKQYAFMVVVGAIVTMWCALSMDVENLKHVALWSGRVLKASGFVAIYGLFVMYLATHDLLERWRVTAKFIAIKVVVLLITYQEIFVPMAMKHMNPASTTCLADPAFPHDEEIQMKHREHWTNMYLTAIESVLLSVLVRKAFPAEELTDKDSSYHMVLLELELERMANERRTRRRIGKKASGSGDDDSDTASEATTADDEEARDRGLD